MFKKLLYTGVVFTLVGCANTSEPTRDETEDDVNEEQTEEASSEVKDTGYRFIENTELMEQVEASEDAIREQWDADTYTAEAPLVVLDPYDVAPLSALVMFETEEPVSVTYFAEGKTEETTFPNSIEEFNTVHELQVLGLYAGVANNVHIELEDEEGNLSEHVVQIETEVSMADKFYQSCGSLYHSLRKNLPPFAVYFTSS